MLKKISLVFLLFILMFSSSYGVEYLNSCGKQSAWTDNEIYILNFTEVLESDLTTDNSCFSMTTTGTINNITFQGNGDVIFSNNLRDFLYIDNDDSLTQINDLTFDQVKLDSLTVGGAGSFMNAQIFQVANIQINDFEILDTYVNNYENIFETEDVSTAGGQWRTGNINNSYLSAQTYWKGENGNGPRYFDVAVIDSIIIAPTISTGVSSGRYTLATFKNSAVLYTLDDATAEAQSVYNRSITLKHKANDTNNDNVDDLGTVGSNVNSKVRLDLTVIGKDYSFIQDVNEGDDFGDMSNRIIVNLQDESINGTNPLILPTTTDSVLDSTFSELDYDFFGTYILYSTQQVDCSIFNLSKCLHVDNAGFTSTSGDTYRGLIEIQSNVTLNNMQFIKRSPNNAQLIANSLLTTLTQVVITNNDIDKIDDNFRNGDSHLIKLLSNMIDFSYNNVTVNYGSDTTYELFDISSTLPDTNIFTRNVFNNLIVSPTNDTEIFTNNCDVKFYNNNVKSNMVITESCSGVDATVKVNYLHSDGKIYVFEIGNFYEDNVGCVDGGGDGICDGSYINGGVNDTKPLASYPFIFTNHLFTADQVINTQGYNVTLVDITDNQNITIADGLTPLIFTFQHDSDFTDLSCQFLIDGSVEDTINGAIKNVDTNSTPLSSWTEKAYTHSVECSNNILIDNVSTTQYISSPEITFNIIFGSGNVTPPIINGTPVDNTSIFGGGSSEFNLITDDIDETFDNTIGLVSSFSNSISSILIPFAIFIFVMFIVFAVINLLHI